MDEQRVYHFKIFLILKISCLEIAALHCKINPGMKRKGDFDGNRRLISYFALVRGNYF
jgi:hypothetical protein